MKTAENGIAFAKDLPTGPTGVIVYVYASPEKIANAVKVITGIECDESYPWTGLARCQEAGYDMPDLGRRVAATIGCKYTEYKA